MRAFGELFAILIIGLFVGGALAWLSIQKNHGFGTLTIGQWTAWPQAGSINADPYSKAKVAADGDVPLGAAEGIAFHAIADQRGNTLRRNCQYKLSGLTPPARLWTLAAHDLDDRALFKSDGRSSNLVSRELLRESNGQFVIFAGPELASKNWLEIDRGDENNVSSGGDQNGGSGGTRREPFKLILRLYDSPVTSAGREADASMPTVTLIGCKS
ncbi:MAG: DUF1214 domain-containing protein [Rhizobiaceae bacterium]|nr:DUF1214 domain-containing protein [Rhizobiaceae bacterium]